MANAISEALQGVGEVEITVTGRKSGRQISHPVWFVQEEDSVFLVPVTGSNSDWYKNVQRTPMIQLAANGTALSSSATPITEADRVNHVVAMFRDKYGAERVEAFYPRRDVAVQVPLG